MQGSKRLVLHLMILVFALVAISICLASMHGVSAATKTWANSGTGLASTGTWSPDGAPSSGDNLVFDATSSGQCTLDQALTYGTISMNTGAGIVIVGANFGCTGITKTAGTFTGSSTYMVTDSGDFIVNSASMNNIKLTMTGTGKVITCSGGIIFHTLVISGTVTASTGTTLTDSAALIISGGGVLTINTAYNHNTYMWTSFNNLGTINGPGLLTFLLHNEDITASALASTGDVFVLGTINCPLKIEAINGCAASRLMNLFGNTVLGSTLVVDSADAAKTMTLDLRGYSFTCQGLTVSTRGKMNSSANARIVCAGAVTVPANGILDATNIPWVSCGGDWNPSAGTWTPDDCQVNMTGSGTTTMGAAQTFYNLKVSTGVTRTLASNIVVTALKDMAGTLVQSTYTVTISGTSTNPARLNGTWSGTISITSSGSSYTIYAGDTWTGTLQAAKTMTIITPTHHLTVTPGTANTYNITLKNGHGLWAGSSTASLSLSFSWTSLTPSVDYGVWADAVKVGKFISNASGVLNFSYNSWSQHNMTYDAYPLITTVPSTTTHQMDPYYYDANASEPVTWTISFSDSQLSYDSNGVISGDLLQLKDVNVSIMATDSVGNTCNQTYTIVVSMPDYVATYSPMLVEVVTIFTTLLVVGMCIDLMRRKR